MEEREVAHPRVDAGTGTWTDQLQVFGQDFDTAMAIWSLEDAAVGRLCADEAPMTRQRRNITANQLELGQLSDISQSTATTPRRKKRRRVVEERLGRDVPPPPCQSVGEMQDKTRECTQLQLVNGVAVSSCLPETHLVEAENDAFVSTQMILPQADHPVTSPDTGRSGQVHQCTSLVLNIQSSTCEQDSTGGVDLSAEDECLRYRAPEQFAPEETLTVDRSRNGTDGDVTMVPRFQTGSGESIALSRKRLRQLEADLVAGENGGKVRAGCDPTSDVLMSEVPRNMVQTKSSVASVGSSNDAPRLSFSSISCCDEDASPPSDGFKTGSGRRIRFQPETLQKYAALLYEEDADLHPSHVCSDKPLPASVVSMHQHSGSATSTSGKRLDHHRHDQKSRWEINHPPSPGAYAADTQETVGLQAMPRDAAVASARIQTGFQTGLGKCVAASAVSLSQYAQSLFASEPLGVTLSSTPRTSSVDTVSPAHGFQTASGRKVTFSEERLREMQERLFSEGIPRPDPSRSNLAESVVSGDVDSTRLVPSGFQSASGARIRISQDKLQQYKSLIQSGDIPGSVCGEESSPSVTFGDRSVARVVGFTTASGTQVSVSKEALQAYEKVFEDQCPSGQSSVQGDHLPFEKPRSASSVLSGFTTGNGNQVHVSEKKVREYEQMLAHNSKVECEERKEPAATTPMQLSNPVLTGFTTGRGSNVAISSEKLREYEKKLAQDDLAKTDPSEQLRGGELSSRKAVVVGSKTGDGQGASITEATFRRFEEELAGETSSAVDSETTVGIDLGHDNESDEFRLRVRTGMKESRHKASICDELAAGPKLRRSIGSVPIPTAAMPTNRRHSLPPRAQVRKTSDEGVPRVVSLGVIKRMSIASQRNPRPAILEDVSNTSAMRPRVNGMNSGKFQPPQPSNGGYTTPAKQRVNTTQNLSTKKGFRPPVPSKTPPSKSLVTPHKSPPRIIGENKERQAQLSVAMPIHEAMRISYKLLFADSMLNQLGFQSEKRATMLRHIDASNAHSIIFSRTDDSFNSGSADDALDGEGMVTIFEQMKTRRYLGDEKEVTEDWFRNHYRWVVWKLATMELQSPRFLFGRYLTKGQVMYQICKRYQRDIVLAQRSPLKKILHRDASSASCMILRVAAVLPYPIEEEKDVDVIPPPHWKLAVVLTDGWYGVHAVPDLSLAEALWKFHRQGRLLGMKVVTWSASLQNASDGIDPLECAIASEDKWANPLWSGKDDPSRWPYLKLQYNSTRPARSNARLGLEALVRSPTNGRQVDAPYDFVLLKSIPMRSLEVGGGIARSVRVRVARISPILHLQPKDFSIGPRILCEEHMPQYFQARQDYLMSLKAAADHGHDFEAPSLPMPMPFVKLEVVCAHNPAAASNCFAVLTVWRPSEEMLQKLKEGGEYFVTNLSVNWKVDYGHQGVFLRVGTTKGSVLEPALHLPGLSASNPTANTRACESIGRLIERYRDHTSSMPRETKVFADVCVVILRVGETKQASIKNPQAASVTSTEHVFVTDESCKIMSIRLTSTRVFRPTTALGEQNGDSAVQSRLPERVFRRGSKKLWTEGTVVCISGLEVSHYDERLDVLDCELVESAQVVSLPSKKSFFYDDAQRLRSLLGFSNKACAETEKFSRDVEGLKRYIERRILLLDFDPSQNDEDTIEDETSRSDGDDEVEHLTQDLIAQSDGDISHWMSQAPLICVEGCMVKVLLLPEGDSRVVVCDSIALAYVRSTSNQDDDGAQYALYLSRELLEKTKSLVQYDPVDSGREDAAGEVVNPQLRFEAQWETSERLLNSWKPWERDGGATFLMATSVSAVSAE